MFTFALLHGFLITVKTLCDRLPFALNWSVFNPSQSAGSINFYCSSTKLRLGAVAHYLIPVF